MAFSIYTFCLAHSRPEEEIDETTGWPALQVPSDGGADGGPRRSWWRAAATLVEAAGHWKKDAAALGVETARRRL